MLNDTRLRSLIDFPDATEAFPGTQIKGGVSYFLWDRNWSDGCEVTTIEKGKPTSPPVRRHLKTYDVLVRRNEALPILEKVLKLKEKEKYGSLESRVSSIQPFSIRTNFRGATSPKGLKKPVEVIGNGGSTFIERKDLPRNDDWVDQWKVLTGPGTACSETYLVIGLFSSEAGAARYAMYLQTRFVRFLVSLRKYTQHIYNERFKFVPDLPMNQKWTDEKLYEKFGITEDEILFIESMIRPMESDNE
jgi:site-specific DNA-methyltransferase (adenine-specific)